ncbi:MAG: dihydropteroate synthase [Methanocorpusculum parvum]|nr:dihydropteroate synthase [Methanocorpusculum parvum]
MSRAIRIKSVSVGGNNPPRILGVLNISPESFFTDSFTPCSQVFRRAEEMRRAGADIIDLGARSTALNAPPLSASEEKERVVSALRDLEGCGLPISLDTCRAEVLTAALHYDISLVNDISGLSDEVYAKAVADSGLPAILMASDVLPGDPLNFAETNAALSFVLSRAEKYGIEDIILDPGIGKWTKERTSDADWELCRRFSELKSYNLPLLAAVSRKSFIGECLDKPPHERIFGSLAVFYHLMESGADLLRVHDVGAAADFVKIFTRLNGED